MDNRATISKKSPPNNKTARFDAKLSLEQKERFEHAAAIGGFRSLTDFVVASAEEKARLIIQAHQILTSQEDKKAFFNAILNPPAPNNALVEAAKKYKEKYNNQH